MCVDTRKRSLLMLRPLRIIFNKVERRSKHVCCHKKQLYRWTNPLKNGLKNALVWTELFHFLHHHHSNKPRLNTYQYKSDLSRSKLC